MTFMESMEFIEVSYIYTKSIPFNNTLSNLSHIMLLVNNQNILHYCNCIVKVLLKQLDLLDDRSVGWAGTDRSKSSCSRSECRRHK